MRRIERGLRGSGGLGRIKVPGTFRSAGDFDTHFNITLARNQTAIQFRIVDKVAINAGYSRIEFKSGCYDCPGRSLEALPIDNIDNRADEIAQSTAFTGDFWMGATTPG